jgi:hypothetical protein
LQGRNKDIISFNTHKVTAWIESKLKKEVLFFQKKKERNKGVQIFYQIPRAIPPPPKADLLQCLQS